MPDLKTYLSTLCEYAPLHIKEEWDNVGLMCGDEKSEIKGIIISLDLTLSVIDEAIENECNLIITHHPLIFGGIDVIDYNTPMGKKIKKLIKNDINVISMHTNLDKAKGGVNDTLCEKLGLSDIKNLTDEDFSIGRAGVLEKETTLKDFVLSVKEKLGTKGIKYVGNDERKIKKVAVVSGSGSEFYMDAIKCGADVFITSEIKHHIAIDTLERDFAIIDAGHFETENIITEKIKYYLSEKYDVKILTSQSYNELFKEV